LGDEAAEDAEGKQSKDKTSGEAAKKNQESINDGNQL